MRGKKLSLLMTALLLFGVNAVWAAQAKAPSKTPKAKEAKTEAKIHQTTGTISSLTSTSLVLSHKRLKVKATETTFVLNPKTKKEGHLEKGAKATVFYRVENDEKVATKVTVHEPKPPAKPGAKKAKTS